MGIKSWREQLSGMVLHQDQIRTGFGHRGLAEIHIISVMTIFYGNLWLLAQPDCRFQGLARTTLLCSHKFWYWHAWSRKLSLTPGPLILKMVGILAKSVVPRSRSLVVPALISIKAHRLYNQHSVNAL